MNKYYELKQKQEKERNGFPMFFAFNKKQFKEGMEKLGLNSNDIDKIYNIGYGGFIRKKDSEKFTGLFDKHNKEMRSAINSDTTGEAFIFDMFSYELANHEYIITCSLADTLDALDLTLEEVNNNKLLLKGLNLAKKDYIKSYKDVV